MDHSDGRTAISQSIARAAQYGPSWRKVLTPQPLE
jgi:hypothetical protein